ncbi:helix-turn-helix domain-containing protein [Roseomonas nepalensis]|uniref:Helix-turn-helix domain-containing protein n=1 Tax=Muricoccus nepalensis TaxID=1854500 RepID=A0A502EZS0_9PROT|nr:helix-turn-helix domain containing protein [Roseomonas nepalensis]TPG41856.1 helix-turn-helix domain-containing protein [Roseomonas nepalensis]
MKHVDMRSLAPEAQEERRRQVIGLRQAEQTYAAIAAQVGLTPTEVFDICKRLAARGRAGLKSKARGPAPGHGSLLAEEQEAEVQALIRKRMPDELGLAFALWSRAAVQALVRQRFGATMAVRTMGSCPWEHNESEGGHASTPPPDPSFFARNNQKGYRMRRALILVAIGLVGCSGTGVLKVGPNRYRITQEAHIAAARAEPSVVHSRPTSTAPSAARRRTFASLMPARPRAGAKPPPARSFPVSRVDRPYQRLRWITGDDPLATINL